MALRYFARANRFSRTVSAFAEFHATTRGTASQTVKGLVEQGYLVRTRSETDGRSARVDLTDKARAILVHDPVEVVVVAADALPARHRAQLVKVLERILAHVARERGRAHFGVCSSCAHLRNGNGRGKRRQSHQCGLLNEPLSPEDTGQVCISFEPN